MLLRRLVCGISDLAPAAGGDWRWRVARAKLDGWQRAACKRDLSLPFSSHRIRGLPRESRETIDGYTRLYTP